MNSEVEDPLYRMQFWFAGRVTANTVATLTKVVFCAMILSFALTESALSATS